MASIELTFGNKVCRNGVDITPTQLYSLLRRTEKLSTTSGSLPSPYLKPITGSARELTKLSTGYNARTGQDYEEATAVNSGNH